MLCSSLPMILVGGAISRDDIARLGVWAEWSLLAVSCFTIAEWNFGLAPFFPVNEITRLIYTSHDVASGYYRLPASFTSAHAYGGTMVTLLPLLLLRLEGVKVRRWLTLAAIGLASLGVFACGARSPVVLFGIVLGGVESLSAAREAVMAHNARSCHGPCRLCSFRKRPASRDSKL